MLAALSSVLGHAGGYKDGVYYPIPTTGYGCDRPCDDADINYELRAVVKSYTIPGSRNVGKYESGNDIQELIYGEVPVGDPRRKDWKYYTRSFERGQKMKNEAYCAEDMFSNDGPLGPCLTASPGQTMNIKVVNLMGNAMEKTGTHLQTLEEWNKVMKRHAEVDGGFGKMIYDKGNAPTGFVQPDGTPLTEMVSEENKENLPGYDTGHPKPGSKAYNERPVDELGDKTWGFDSTNLHLHGLEVEPHLFYPQGTPEPDAPWITITPDEHIENGENHQCFCYSFHISQEQAIGTFLYHIHRHGSSAYQAWSGMAGAFLVVPPPQSYVDAMPEADERDRTHKEHMVARMGPENNADDYLATKGIKDYPFVIWDPHMKSNTYHQGDKPAPGARNAAICYDSPGKDCCSTAPLTETRWSGVLSKSLSFTTGELTGCNWKADDPTDVQLTTDEFVSGQTSYGIIKVLVNNEFQPTLPEIRPNEVMRIRIVCMTEGNLCAFRIRANHANGEPDMHGKMTHMLHIASDGFTFPPVEKEFFVMAAGYRHDVLVQFPNAGSYSILQEGIEQMQWFGTGPENQLLAHIKVSGTPVSPAPEPHSWAVPWGRALSKDIKRSEIFDSRTIGFTMESDLGLVPYQQYKVDWSGARGFDIRRTDQVIGVLNEDGTPHAEEWRVYNTQNMNHPFHIHVNPFQVKEVKSDFHYMMTVPHDTPGSKWCGVFEEGVCEDTHHALEWRKSIIDDQMVPPNQWHDTILVPPYGSVRIWHRFQADFRSGGPVAFVGKTVFHCHFLVHEDTGMISTVLLTMFPHKVSDRLDRRGYLKPPQCPAGCKPVKQLHYNLEVGKHLHPPGADYHHRVLSPRKNRKLLFASAVPSGAPVEPHGPEEHEDDGDKPDYEPDDFLPDEDGSNPEAHQGYDSKCGLGCIPA